MSEEKNQDPLQGLTYHVHIYFHAQKNVRSLPKTISASFSEEFN